MVEPITQTVADIPAARVSADEINILTEPLMDDDVRLVRNKTKSKSSGWYLLLQVVGALIVAAALVFLLRESDDIQSGRRGKLAAVGAVLIGLWIALMPSILRSSHYRKNRPRW